MSQTKTLADDVKSRSGWSIFMGVLIVVVGTLLIVYPLLTAAITTVFLGWALIFVGLAEIVLAFNSTTAGSFFLKILFGALYGIAGIALAFFPMEGVATLTAFLGVLLVVQAGMSTVLAFQVRPANGWGWILFDGITSLIMGGLILMSWPSSSVWAIGTLVGVAVLFRGVGRIVISAGIRKGAADAERFAHAS